MKFVRLTLIFLAILVSSMAISHADVMVNNIVPPTLLLPSINNQWTGDAIGSIIAWLIRLTAVLTVLTITWAGVQMVIATGEEEKFKKARYTMIYAFIGLIVAGLAYGIVTFITKLNLNNIFF